MLELGDDGNAATIGEQVTDAEYAAAPDVDAQDDATSYLTRRNE
jgi:hypothetical protein